MDKNIKSPFYDRILNALSQAGMQFPGLDDQAILDQIVPNAEEWIILKIVTNHLEVDDQAFFRDAYLSAPDVFDPVEFLSDTLPDFEVLLQKYFEEWFADFSQNISK